MNEPHFNSYRVTRRGLLRQAGGLAALSAIGNVALLRGAAAQEAPQRGGIMTLQISRDPSNFDMFSNTSSYTLNVCGACYNSLVMYDPVDPQSIIGDLAESWTISDDGLSYVFTLRQGVKFHDGVPFTANDVKATFDFVRSPPEGQVSTRKNLLAAVSDIVVVDDHTVRFELSRPTPALLENLAIGWMVVAPKHVLDAKGNMKEDVVGTGPFKFKNYTVGTVIELERNAEYHIPDRPYLDGMQIYIIPEPSTIMAYLRGGQLDYWDGIGARDQRIIEGEFPDVVEVKVSPIPTAANSLEINTARAPFTDIRVRNAIALAYDHAEGVKFAADVGATDWGGIMTPASKWALPPDQLHAISGYGTDIEANRARARELLAEAGFPNGLDTTLMYRKGPEVQEVSAVYSADQLSKIGVRAKIVVQESAMYFDLIAKKDFDLTAGSISALTTDPDSVLADFFSCNGGSNNTSICMPVIDELIARQSATIDFDERLKLVHEVEKLILEQYGFIPAFYRRKRIANSRRIKNLVAHPEPDNNRRMQDVWIG